METPTQELFVRVWTCVYLHSMGYLPLAAGIKTDQTELDQARMKECEKHGAVLAMTKDRGAYVPLAPGHITNELNTMVLDAVRREDREKAEWLVKGREQRRARPKQAGRTGPADDETPEERAARLAFVSVEEVRQELAALEQHGFIVRTDDEATPLAEMKGQEKLKFLHGKTRIFLFLVPKRDALLIGGLFSPQSAENKESAKLVFMPPPPIQLLLHFAAQKAIGISPEKLAVYGERKEIQHRLILMSKKRQELEAQEKALQDELLKLAAQDAPTVSDGNKASAESQAAAQERRGLSVAHASTTVAAPAEDWDCFGLAVAPYFPGVDDAWLAATVKECRSKRPDLTPSELAQVCHLKAPDVLKRRQGLGYLRTCIVNVVVGKTFDRLRLSWRAAAEADQQQKAAQKVTSCPDCGGSGLIGADWSTVAEAIEAVRRGAQYCHCPDGTIAREFVEPAEDVRSTA